MTCNLSAMVAVLHNADKRTTDLGPMVSPTCIDVPGELGVRRLRSS